MVFCVVFVVVFELFQTIVQGGVLKYTSQFLTSCADHANLCRLKDLLTCGRKDVLQLRNTSVYWCCCDTRPQLLFHACMHVCCLMCIWKCVSLYIYLCTHMVCNVNTTTEAFSQLLLLFLVKFLDETAPHSASHLGSQGSMLA